MERGIKAEIIQLKEKGWVAKYVNGVQVNRRSTTNDKNVLLKSVINANTSLVPMQITTLSASPDAQQNVPERHAETTQGARSNTRAMTVFSSLNTKIQDLRSKKR